MVGNTGSTDFPATSGAFDTNLGVISQGVTYQDAFVPSSIPSGSALVYSTYLGGNDGEIGLGIAVDASGSAYVTGSTASTDFPTTPGVLQNTLTPGVSQNTLRNVWRMPLSLRIQSALARRSGLSTYLGGSGEYEQGSGIAVDANGNAYVTGSTASADFPVLGATISQLR